MNDSARQGVQSWRDPRPELTRSAGHRAAVFVKESSSRSSQKECPAGTSLDCYGLAAASVTRGGGLPAGSLEPKWLRRARRWRTKGRWRRRGAEVVGRVRGGGGGSRRRGRSRPRTPWRQPAGQPREVLLPRLSPAGRIPQAVSRGALFPACRIQRRHAPAPLAPQPISLACGRGAAGGLRFRLWRLAGAPEPGPRRPAPPARRLAAAAAALGPGATSCSVTSVLCF